MEKVNGVLSNVGTEDIQLLNDNPTEFWKNVTKIGDLAFHFCSEITNITIPTTVTEIGIGSFADCTNLTNIVIPSSVTKIGNSAFFKCTSLFNISIPLGLTKIESGIFKDCKSLTSIIIPNGITHIGSDAFDGCSSLTSVTIPSSVTGIGDYAFMNCTNLGNLYIPNTVKTIGFDILKGCENITNVTIQSLAGKNVEASTSLLNKLYQDYFVAMQEEKSLKRFNNLCKQFNLDDKNSSYVAFFRMSKVLGLLETDDVTLDKNGKDIPVADISFEILQKGLRQGDINYDNMNIDVSTLSLEEFNINLLKFLNKDKNTASQLFSKMDKFTQINNWFKARSGLEIQGQTQLEGVVPTTEENRFRICKYSECQGGVFRTRWYAPTVELILDDLSANKYTGITPKNLRIAKVLAKHNYNQDQFDKAVEIDSEREERVKAGEISNSIISTLIKESLIEAVEKYKKSLDKMESEVASNLTECTAKLADDREYIFTYEMLDKSSEENFVIGNLTSCCAKLFGSGAGAQRAMIIHPDMQPLVVRDVSGEIIAFSIVYVNREKGYAVLDDIEMNNKYDSKSSNIVKQIYDKVIEGLEKFVETYNAENKKPITQVNTGVCPRPGNALSKLVIQNPKAETHLDAIDFNEYNYNNLGYWKPDWFGGQYVLWSSDKENTHGK